MFEESKDYDYNQSKKTECLVIKSRKFSQYSDRYGSLVYPSIFVLFGIMGLHAFFFDNPPTYFVLLSISMFCVGIFLFFISIQGFKLGQKFLRLKASHDDKLNRQIAVATINELGWRILKNTKDSLMAVTNTTMFTWGQIIIILYDKDEILVCCDNRTGPFVKAPILSKTHKNRINDFYDIFINKLK